MLFCFKHLLQNWFDTTEIGNFPLIATVIIFSVPMVCPDSSTALQTTCDIDSQCPTDYYCPLLIGYCCRRSASATLPTVTTAQAARVTTLAAPPTSTRKPLCHPPKHCLAIIFGTF